MTDKLYTQTEGGIRYWTREELLIRAETAEAEVERAEAQAHEFESEAIHNGEIMQSLAAEVAALKVRIAEMEAAASASSGAGGWAGVGESCVFGDGGGAGMKTPVCGLCGKEIYEGPVFIGRTLIDEGVIIEHRDCREAQDILDGMVKVSKFFDAYTLARAAGAAGRRSLS